MRNSILCCFFYNLTRRITFGIVFRHTQFIHLGFISCFINSFPLKCWQVPVAAAVYYEDMYVNFKLAMETASQIAGIRLWITNEYMHSGLRDGGGQVFDHLIGMLNGKKPLF